MIVYKVVGKGTRHCTNWVLFSSYLRYLNQNRKTFLRKHKELKEFVPRYLKGTIVKAAPNSVGILTFGTIKSAKAFIVSEGGLDSRKIKIIKVQGMGKPNRSFVIKRSCGSEIVNLTSTWALTKPPFNGSIAFKSVRVLE